MHEIAITLEGGIIQDIDNIPPGVTVKVMDFDTDGVDESELCRNGHGEEYVLSRFGSPEGQLLLDRIKTRVADLPAMLGDVQAKNDRLTGMLYGRLWSIRRLLEEAGT